MGHNFDVEYLTKPCSTQMSTLAYDLLTFLRLAEQLHHVTIKIQGVFFTGPPPKMSKYRTVNLG